MKQVKSYGVQLIAMVLCCMGVTSCKQQAPQQVKSTYETMTVTTSDRELTSTYSASIEGRQDVAVMPQVSGTIQRVCVSEGQKVRRGQSLFVIDQVPYRASLNTARANVEVAKAQLATAELNYNSNKELYAQKVVSEFTLKTAENNYLTAKASLAQAEAGLVNAQNNMNYTEVRSSADGVVGAIPYRVGTLVSPSMAKPLTTVSDNSQMYVYFSMTENQLLNLTREHGSMDEAVKQMPPVKLQLNDGTLYGDSGRIESISGVIDRQTGTVTARAVFPNAGRLLVSGANGAVIIPSTFKNCIVVPQEATVRIQDKYFVYKVVDGKAASTEVQVSSISDGREYVVLGGLKAGEEIVAKGAGLVREGTQIK